MFVVSEHPAPRSRRPRARRPPRERRDGCKGGSGEWLTAALDSGRRRRAVGSGSRVIRAPRRNRGLQDLDRVEQGEELKADLLLPLLARGEGGRLRAIELEIGLVRRAQAAHALVDLAVELDAE